MPLLFYPSKFLMICSQEATVHRCLQGVAGHCKGVLRCVSASQIVFRRNQRVDHTLRGKPSRDNQPISLTVIDKEYADVKEKLNDLIPWVKRLLVTLAKADPSNDLEEADRRSQLAGFVLCPEFLVRPKLILYDRLLDDIGKQAVAMLEKGKVARFLDKRKDSGEVAALVEKLKQAILDYQVGVRDRWIQRLLTRDAGVTTTSDIQPNWPDDRESLLLALCLEID